MSCRNLGGLIHEAAIRPALRKLLPDPIVLTPTDEGGYVLEGTAVLDLNAKRHFVWLLKCHFNQPTE